MQLHGVMADNWPLSSVEGEFVDGEWAGQEVNLDGVSGRIPSEHRYLTIDRTYLVPEEAASRGGVGI